MKTAITEPIDLIGRSDMTEIFGIARSTPGAWITRHSQDPDHPFPDPVAVINFGETEVYDKADVVAWGRVTGRLDLEHGRIYDENGYDITDMPMTQLMRTIDLIQQERASA